MISHDLAKQLGIKAEIPNKITNPSFATSKPLWIKSDYHPRIDPTQLNNPRFQYNKVGKIFSFQRTRYITFYQDHFFYFEEQNDTNFKGYCCFRDLYFAFYPLQTKRFVFYLSNANQQSIFFFDNDLFYQTVKKSLQNNTILLNFSQKYLIQNSLGKGSFSQVYLIKDKETKQLYAAKIISKLDKNKAPTKNLVQEQRKILQKINSQFVYEFDQFYEQNDSYIFVLEYLTGKDLMTLFKEQTEFSMSDLIYIFQSILKGLSDIHKLKIYHRDLKPQNIIINLSTLKPKIIDFGLSLLIQPHTDVKNFKRCGTMGYMAPQVIANTSQVRKPYTEKCDIFSFGIIAHMILMGKNPLKGKTYEQTYSKNKLCEISLEKEAIIQKYGENCFQFIQKMLQKNPKLRSSAQQLLKSEFLCSDYEHKAIKNNKQESAQTASQQLKANPTKNESEKQID